MGKPEAQSSAQRQFERSVSSVAGARLFVTQFLSDVPGARRDDAILIVSELAANAVAHARSPFTVSLTRHGEAFRIEVSDTGAGVPQMRSPEPDEAFGRGLSIVNQLAGRWGFDPQAGGGKTVWAELAAVDSHGYVQ